MPYASWIDPQFRAYMQSLPTRVTTLVAFSREVRTALQHPLIESGSVKLLLAALRERDWIVVEHELRAREHHLLQTLPEAILASDVDQAIIKERASVICALRLLAEQARCFRNLPKTKK